MPQKKSTNIRREIKILVKVVTHSRSMTRRDRVRFNRHFPQFMQFRHARRLRNVTSISIALSATSGRQRRKYRIQTVVEDIVDNYPFYFCK